jgi:hypothetical protein
MKQGKKVIVAGTAISVGRPGTVILLGLVGLL